MASYPSDETIKALRKIATLAESMTIRANWLIKDVDALCHRPDWETLAEDEIERAIKYAKRAQERLEEALAKIKAKPHEERKSGSQ